MGIRLFFDKAYVKVRPLHLELCAPHVTSHDRDDGDGRKVTDWYIGDTLRAHEVNGMFYVEHPNLDAPLHPHINEGTIGKITLLTNIPISPPRETGVYSHPKHKKIHAWVTKTFSTGKEALQVRIESKRPHISEVRELFLLISTGKLRPIESFEEEQDGVSKADLSSEVLRLQNTLKESEKSKNRLHEELTELKRKSAKFFKAWEEINKFYNTIVSGAWWRRRSKLMKALFPIIDPENKNGLY